MSGVNLDAYIKREDLRISEEKFSNDDYSTIAEISLNDLVKGSVIFSLLRKPDFQRETDDWDVKKVANLVENFLDGDLIPSIILWRSPKNLIFVLDGAHRLSALAAWVNGDYGDGEISKSLFGNNISYNQLQKARKTRELIENKIGTYKEITQIDLSQDTLKAERAKKLSLRKIDIQWVRGNAQKAEESFFRINQNPAKVSSTEINLLKFRKSPLAIASRAIIRGGNGHKYWGEFSLEGQKKIEYLANEIYLSLFEPELKGDVFNTIDLPMGGVPHSNATLTMIHDLVEIINENYYELPRIHDDNNDLEKQLDIFEYLNDLENENKDTSNVESNEEITVKILENCKKIFNRINSMSNGSLGINPIIYFYSHRTGNFQVSSLMMTVEFIKYLEKERLFDEFIQNRAQFEKFLVEYNYFLEQIIIKHGSGRKSYKHLYNFIITILNLFRSGIQNDKTIVDKLIEGEFNYLKVNPTIDAGLNKNFSSKIKNALYISEALKSALKCKICGGYVPNSSISYDHIIRKDDGGKGSIENGQITHPYCNVVYKN